jgi:hypothetical protein
MFAEAARVVVPELLALFSEIRARAGYGSGVDFVAFLDFGIKELLGIRIGDYLKVILAASLEIVKSGCNDRDQGGYGKPRHLEFSLATPKCILPLPSAGDMFLGSMVNSGTLKNIRSRGFCQ